MAAMDKPKLSTETPDDTPIIQDPAEPSNVVPTDDTIQHASASIELAIETLAGLDAAEAPDLADDLAGRLRAELLDS